MQAQELYILKKKEKKGWSTHCLNYYELSSHVEFDLRTGNKSKVNL